jgi:hypothetical protein
MGKLKLNEQLNLPGRVPPVEIRRGHNRAEKYGNNES